MPKKLTPLNIRDPGVYQMARKLANLTGKSMTEVVRQTQRDRLTREERRKLRSDDEIIATTSTGYHADGHRHVSAHGYCPGGTRRGGISALDPIADYRLISSVTVLERAAWARPVSLYVARRSWYRSMRNRRT